MELLKALVSILILSLVVLARPVTAAAETKWRTVARAVALETWGQPPGCEEVRVRRRSLVPSDPTGFPVSGWIDGNLACTFYIRKPWHPTWEFYCSTFVHEWGHLMLGPGHNPDPNHVMAEGRLREGPYWRCLRTAVWYRMSGRDWDPRDGMVWAP